MKYSYLLLIIIFSFFQSWNSFSQRYLTEVFSDYSVSQDVQFASVISVINGGPTAEDLFMDIYEPTGDTETNRPVIIIAHDGEYLPESLNQLPYGNFRDSAVVHMCGRLAKRGFVVVSYSHRLGWNPTSFDQDIRTGTYINAYYRAVQDGFTAVRFLRMDALTNGNNYGIDESKIVSGGFGTGGNVSLSMAFLDDFSGFSHAQYYSGSGFHYIDTSLSGNIYATETHPLTIANHESFNSDVQMAFNLGGAIGDSTWIEAGDIPVVSFASPSDPFSPYDFGATIVATTNDFLINSFGSKGIQRRQQVHNNNASFTNAIFTDQYTNQANLINNGLQGLYPFIRPTTENSPWNYWDFPTWDIPHSSGGTYNEYGMLTNPDMSVTKGQTYLDTAINYLCPRIVCALSLPGCTLNSIDEIDGNNAFSIYPNPNNGCFTIDFQEGVVANSTLLIMDLTGKEIYKTTVNTNLIDIELVNVNSGMYIVTVANQRELYKKRIIIE